MFLRSSYMTRMLISPLLVMICLAGHSKSPGQLHASFDWMRLGPVTLNQSAKTAHEQTRQEKEDEDVLTPLTDEERLLVPRDIIAGQPDFAADLNFFVSHQVSGFGGSARV